MKVPDSGRIAEQACLFRDPDIGRAKRYEQGGREPGLRIPVAGAGVRSTEHPAFILQPP